MEIKIQLEIKNYLSGYEGISRVNNLSCGIGSPDLFKRECDLEWARGNNIPVKQVLIFSEATFIGRMRVGDTLENFVKGGKINSSIYNRHKNTCGNYLCAEIYSTFTQPVVPSMNFCFLVLNS
jgi:hypothetical protein